MGLLVVWVTGTGKLAALWAALRSDPTGGGANPNPAPPSGSTTPGSTYTGPDGKLYVVGPDGQPLQVMG